MVVLIYIWFSNCTNLPCESETKKVSSFVLAFFSKSVRYSTHYQILRMVTEHKWNINLSSFVRTQWYVSHFCREFIVKRKRRLYRFLTDTKTDMPLIDVGETYRIQDRSTMDMKTVCHLELDRVHYHVREPIDKDNGSRWQGLPMVGGCIGQLIRELSCHLYIDLNSLRQVRGRCRVACGLITTNFGLIITEDESSKHLWKWRKSLHTWGKKCLDYEFSWDKRGIFRFQAHIFGPI